MAIISSGSRIHALCDYWKHTSNMNSDAILGQASWFHGYFNYTISDTDTPGKYHVDASYSINTGGNMAWQGESWFKLYLNGVEIAKVATQTVAEGSNEDHGQQPISADFYASGTGTLELEVDLTRTLCDYHSKPYGPDYSGKNAHFKGFKVVADSNCRFTTPPVIGGSLVNTTPYTNPVDGKRYMNISAYETSVGLEYSKTSGDDETHYRHWRTGQNEPSSWASAPSNNRYTESGLTAGTSYNCYCRIYNSAGQSGVASWSGRTRHRIPVVTLSHNHATQAGLEDLYVTWECDKSVACVYYRIRGESNWRIGAGARNATSNLGTSGTIRISETEAVVEGSKDLYAFTNYIIEVKVLSTVSYDSLESSVASISCKTDKRAELTSSSSRNITIGAILRVLKTNESGNRNSIKFGTKAYDSTSSSYTDWCSRSLADNDENITFTQTEWDTVYKRFLNPANAAKSLANHNNIRLLMTLITYGRTRQYTNTYEGLVILTGDMMTAKTNVNGSIKRAKVWCRPDGTIRRGVTWITAQKGVWRRGI